MNPNYTITTVDAENLSQTGFFCYMSRPKAPGYQQKRAWLEARLKEGLTIKILNETGGRDVGFIEYIPGEYAWRAVHAPGYLVIHCLWVVGKGKGKGYGRRLIEACLEDARVRGAAGVVMVASDGVWLASKDIFLRNGFQQTGEAPPSFQLLVYPLRPAEPPVFPADWAERQARFGPGLTVVRTPQCPYIENGTQEVLELAGKRGISARAVELASAAEVQAQSPSPYGVFGVVLDGRLLSYHYLDDKTFAKRLAALEQKEIDHG